MLFHPKGINFIHPNNSIYSKTHINCLILCKSNSSESIIITIITTTTTVIIVIIIIIIIIKVANPITPGLHILEALRGKINNIYYINLLHTDG
jgi:hypothetical protein